MVAGKPRYTGNKLIHPGRFPEDGPETPHGAWSVVCAFDSPPSQQGSPSFGRVSFYVADAPHERFRPGTRFSLHEGPMEVAQVEVLD
jgi:hypothetical protein